MLQVSTDNEIEADYGWDYAQDILGSIYFNINKCQLSLVLGFKQVGKSSIANFLTYNRKHPSHYLRNDKIIFAKFSFNSLTNDSPKSFIFHLINNIGNAILYWNAPIDQPIVRSNFSEYDTLNVLRRLVLNIGRNGYKLVITFDPAEKLTQHPQRPKIYDYLRHLYDHNSKTLSYLFFSNNPNLVHEINESSFGSLANLINDQIIWIKPNQILGFKRLLYQQHSWIERHITKKFSAEAEKHIYELTGGIAGLIYHFRYAKDIPSENTFQLLANQSIINTCRQIITSFSFQQQLFLYYVANQYEQPVQITRADIDILLKCGVLELVNNQYFKIPAQLISDYLKMPETYMQMFGKNAAPANQPFGR